MKKFRCIIGIHKYKGTHPNEARPFTVNIENILEINQLLWNVNIR